MFKKIILEMLMQYHEELHLALQRTRSFAVKRNNEMICIINATITKLMLQ